MRAVHKGMKALPGHHPQRVPFVVIPFFANVTTPLLLNAANSRHGIRQTLNIGVHMERMYNHTLRKQRLMNMFEPLARERKGDEAFGEELLTTNNVTAFYDHTVTFLTGVWHMLQTDQFKKPGLLLSAYNCVMPILTIGGFPDAAPDTIDYSIIFFSVPRSVMQMKDVQASKLLRFGGHVSSEQAALRVHKMNKIVESFRDAVFAFNTAPPPASEGTLEQYAAAQVAGVSAKTAPAAPSATATTNPTAAAAPDTAAAAADPPKKKIALTNVSIAAASV
jgi:hypothetical protein